MGAYFQKVAKYNPIVADNHKVALCKFFVQVFTGQQWVLNIKFEQTYMRCHNKLAKQLNYH